MYAAGLIKAHINSGAPPAAAAADAHAVLARARRAGVIEDAPMHSAIISGYLKARDAEGAEEVFDNMVIHDVQPDAVSFTQARRCHRRRRSCRCFHFMCGTLRSVCTRGCMVLTRCPPQRRSSRRRRYLGDISATSRRYLAQMLTAAAISDRLEHAQHLLRDMDNRDVRRDPSPFLGSFLGPFSAPSRLFGYPIIIGCAFTYIRSCRQSRRTMRTIRASR